MSSRSIEILNEKIRRVQRRRKWIFTLRQISFKFAAFVALFLILGFIEFRFGFTLKGHILLFCLLLLGTGILSVWFFRAIRRYSGDELKLAQYVEDHIPELQQRLLTSMEYQRKEKQGFSQQLLEKLWEDARRQVQSRKIEKVASTRSVWPAAGAALLMLCIVFIISRSLPDFNRTSRQILWPWTHLTKSPIPSQMLAVEPGDIRIRRGEDVTVVATVHRNAPKNIYLYVQAAGGGDWRKNPMTGENDDNTNRYLHFLSSVREDLIYYVDIGRNRSKEYRISVFDMLRVERIDVLYDYPDYTGLASKIEENSGDVVAPKGTKITLRVTFNRPIDQAGLRFSEGVEVNLSAEGTVATGSFTVKTDTTYTINATEQHPEKEQFEKSDPIEYFVQSIPDAPPELDLVLPGKDRQVMPLEEVPIAAVAGDDYGLTKFVLNYSVAGRGDHEVSFLKATKRQKSIAVDGKTLIYLEDLAVTPGDFVTFHLAAVDNNAIDGPTEVFSDIYFLQVIPTDEEFRKAPQQAGGGGAGGMSGGMRPQQSSALVENQKRIIAATWKLLKREKTAPTETLEKDIKIVAESQQKVLQRTRMSLRRLTERFSFSDESYDRAVTHLKNGVTHMEAAIEKLQKAQLKEALGPETAALQAILKAEAESRITQIMASRMGGGFGNGAQNLREREDLRKLFEMEMGRLENRYELPPQAKTRRQQPEQEDIFKKLQDLASRQERLNRAQRDLAQRQDRLTEEQKRRRLEQLRREQEMLRRQSAALSRRMSRLAQRSNDPSDDQQWAHRQQQLDQAARQMQEAIQSLLRRNLDMAASKGQKALENLRQPKKQTPSGQPAMLSDLINTLGRKAEELNAQEKQIQKNLEKAVREQIDKAPSQKIEDLKIAKEKMKQDLTEIEALLRAVGIQGKRIRPETTDKAVDTLRLLKRERVKDQIEESQEMLSQGQLGLSVEKEKRIGQSIHRISKKLQDLGGDDRKSKKNPIYQAHKAASDAESMRRELEMLQRQIDALRNSNQRREKAVSGAEKQPSTQQGRGPNDRSGGRSAERGSNLKPMRERLQNIQRYAQGLLQPWAQGESWSVNARSIHRKLTQKEIEDFLSQPDLWKQLLEDVRELESALRSRAEILKFKENLFLNRENQLPTDYRQLIEEYYRNLSKITDNLN